MSIAASKAVWARTRARGPAKLVLLAFANFADDAGVAWPSAATIAAMTDRTLRNTRKTIAALVAMGELVVIEQRRNRTTKYRLAVCEGVSKTTPPEDERGVENDTPRERPRGVKNDRGGCQKRTSGGVKNDTRTIKEPSMNQGEEEAATAQQAFDRFNEFAEEFGLKTVERLTAKRRALLEARLAECGGPEGWAAVLARIRGSPGLLGDNDRAWKITFDWLITDETRFARIAEGQYDGWSGSAGNGSGRRQSPHEKLLAGWAAAAERAARGG